jgi:hypothetical protein
VVYGSLTTALVFLFATSAARDTAPPYDGPARRSHAARARPTGGPTATTSRAGSRPRSPAHHRHEHLRRRAPVPSPRRRSARCPRDRAPPNPAADSTGAPHESHARAAVTPHRRQATSCHWCPDRSQEPPCLLERPPIARGLQKPRRSVVRKRREPAVVVGARSGVHSQESGRWQGRALWHRRRRRRRTVGG